MSGIAALVSRDGRPAPAADVLAMLDAIPYRGPDGAYARAFDRAVLGYAGMVTTAAERAEKQPVVSSRTGCAIVADMRLDNRTELRAQLAQPPAADASDARLVLCAYEEWGLDAVKRLSGDFAFVIWDPKQRRLVCARDMAGQRTLFYREDAHTFAAASEIHQLLQDPSVPLAPDETRIRSALLPINMRRNAQDQAHTYYAGISSLLPGHQLVLTPDRLDVQRFARLEPAPIRYKRTEEYVDHFRELFFNAVAQRMATDTRLGALLSGGLDSSSIVCATQELYRSGRVPNHGFTSFSAVYGDLECDERPLIADVQARYGFDARFIEPDMSAELSQLEPDGFRSRPEMSTLGTTTLFSAAQASGVRVLLTGELSDNYMRGSGVVFDSLLRQGKFRELRHYHAASRAQPRESLARSLALYGIVPMLPLSIEKWAMARYIERQDRLERWRSMPTWIPADLRETLLDDNLRERLDEESRRMFANHVTHEQHLLLDRPEMPSIPSGWSIEIWRPFAARALQEFALSIPPEQLFAPVAGSTSAYGGSKQLLRRAMRGMLPDSIRLRTNPTVFSATFGNQVETHWQSHSTTFGPGGHSRVADRGYIDPVAFWERLRAYRAGRGGSDFAHLAFMIGLETWLRNLDAPRQRATHVASHVHAAPAVLLKEAPGVAAAHQNAHMSEDSDIHDRIHLSMKGGESWRTRASAPIAHRA